MNTNTSASAITPQNGPGIAINKEAWAKVESGENQHTQDILRSDSYTFTFPSTTTSFTNSWVWKLENLAQGHNNALSGIGMWTTYKILAVEMSIVNVRCKVSTGTNSYGADTFNFYVAPWNREVTIGGANATNVTGHIGNLPGCQCKCWGSSGIISTDDFATGNHETQKGTRTRQRTVRHCGSWLLGTETSATPTKMEKKMTYTPPRDSILIRLS